jgi:hypothetical protein
VSPEPSRLRDYRERRNARDAQAPPVARGGVPPRRRRPDPGPPPAPTLEEAATGQGVGLRRLATPRPVAVRTGERGVPSIVGRLPVEAMLEEWVVEDRWWTGKPVRRRYFELVLVNGRNVVVFKDLVGGRWFAQRA